MMITFEPFVRQKVPLNRFAEEHDLELLVKELPDGGLHVSFRDLYVDQGLFSYPVGTVGENLTTVFADLACQMSNQKLVLRPMTQGAVRFASPDLTIPDDFPVKL